MSNLTFLHWWNPRILIFRTNIMLLNPHLSKCSTAADRAIILLLWLWNTLLPTISLVLNPIRLIKKVLYIRILVDLTHIILQIIFVHIKHVSILAVLHCSYSLPIVWVTFVHGTTIIRLAHAISNCLLWLVVLSESHSFLTSTKSTWRSFSTFIH